MFDKVESSLSPNRLLPRSETIPAATKRHKNTKRLPDVLFFLWLNEAA
jgi:hypothetical protein